jgi:hypothetical protein
MMLRLAQFADCNAILRAGGGDPSTGLVEVLIAHPLFTDRQDHALSNQQLPGGVCLVQASSFGEAISEVSYSGRARVHPPGVALRQLTVLMAKDRP